MKVNRCFMKLRGFAPECGIKVKSELAKFRFSAFCKLSTLVYDELTFAYFSSISALL